ncbi:hypothetical protein X805_12290 [Sphaerotilus natans subsp. natans DSM 6575]|uniref:Uncharacterized protein n=1 Tax=Sphaerotilus natans subsp. natans DSM 6575 TaxID=1286631 RepID=A0A059KQ16_9BURK|nr:hypothetical protein X805_12290 [Sphaerotilus natans subsp. natans DSM 6575]
MESRFHGGRTRGRVRYRQWCRYRRPSRGLDPSAQEHDCHFMAHPHGTDRRRRQGTG